MGILICGLNGAGKSTLGRRLAERLGWDFIDNEDLYFPKTDAAYPYAAPRSKAEVVRLLEARLGRGPRFVCAAVRGDYGETLLSALDCAILLEVPREARLARVRQRSDGKFGGRIEAGGDLAEKENAWFAQVAGRPEDYVTSWLRALPCPVLRIDGTHTVEENVENILSALS